MRVLIILLLLTGTALAQQKPPQMTPINQALSEKILEEINSNVNLRAQIVTLQARIKELEAKLPPEAEQKSATPEQQSAEPPGPGQPGFVKPDLTPFKPKPQ